MNRKSGGLIGKKVVPSGEGATASASGIWNLQDVVDSETSGIYPQPDVPPNAADIVADVTLEVLETKTLAVTFSGATDPDGDTVFDWTITEGSGALSLTPSSFTGVSSATTTFTASNVSVDTDVDITVTVTDQYGLSASKVFTGTDAFTIKNNIAPVVTSVAPTNVSFPLDITESSNQVITFAGATDTEDTDTALTYEIVSISPSSAITSVTPSSDSSSPFTFTFNTAAVSADTNVSFGVKVTDSVGDSNTKTFSNALVVLDNIPPVADNITSTPSTISFSQSSTQSVVFAGATDAEDTNTTLTYSIENISNTSVITGVTPSSDNSVPVTFVFTSGAVSSDTDVTFDVKVTDSAGSTDTKSFTLEVKAATSLTISSNTNNYNIASAVTGAGGSLNNDVILTINSGVTVGSTTSTTAAMYTSTGWGAGTTITIINNGSLVGSTGSNTDGNGGSGGNGGGQYQNGGSGSAGSGSAEAANNGGNAFEHSQTADDNLSVVFQTTGTRSGGSAGQRTFKGGGGGGGSGGRGYYYSGFCPGLGGGGARYGAGGSGYGNNGSAGGATLGGSGGPGCGGYGGYGGTGGSGGNLQANGSGGNNGYDGWVGNTTYGTAGGSSGSTNTANGSAGSALSGNTGQIS